MMNEQDRKTLVDTCKEMLLRKELMQLKHHIHTNMDFGFDLPPSEFVIVMAALLKPQSYGIRLQHYLERKLGTMSIPAYRDRGDFMNGRGGYWECKASIIDATNENINLVQLREGQKLDGYYIWGADIRKVDIVIHYLFSLTKEQMAAEIQQMHATSAHGTKTATKENKSIEKRMSLLVDNANINFVRWKAKYLKDIKDIGF